MSLWLVGDFMRQFLLLFATCFHNDDRFSEQFYHKSTRFSRRGPGQQIQDMLVVMQSAEFLNMILCIRYSVSVIWSANHCEFSPQAAAHIL